MLQGTPPMPKKKQRSRGISGMLADLLARAKAGGRPPLGDMIPGAPRPAPMDEYELRYGGGRLSRDQGRVGDPTLPNDLAAADRNLALQSDLATADQNLRRFNVRRRYGGAR